MDKVIFRYPGSFGFWAGLVQTITIGINEIAVLGTNSGKVVEQINRIFIPNKILQSSDKPRDDFALFEGKAIYGNKQLIYLCRNYACEKPVKSIEELILLLKNKKYTITNYDSR